MQDDAQKTLWFVRSKEHADRDVVGDVSDECGDYRHRYQRPKGILTIHNVHTYLKKQLAERAV